MILYANIVFFYHRYISDLSLYLSIFTPHNYEMQNFTLLLFITISTRKALFNLITTSTINIVFSIVEKVQATYERLI